MYLQTRIAVETMRNCRTEVHGHVCYVTCPSPDATDRIYPPSPDSPNSLRVNAVTLQHSSCTLPLRLRVALEDTDAGNSILQKWPLPEPRQHG